jgi:sugar phosphate isomerase/epimerase
MWTLSGFAEEICADLDQQCDVIAELGLNFLEFRSAWGMNILDLDHHQLTRAQRTMSARDLCVSTIGSPIGKIPIEADFEPHLRRMRHAAEVARFFEAPFVRVFSFFIPEGSDPDDHRDEVLRRMSALAKVAEKEEVVLLHENGKGIYGDIPRRCLDLVESVSSAHLKIAWDPANFVQVGVRPYAEAFALLRPYLGYVQIKDAVLGTGELVTAGNGDAEVIETVRALHQGGFDGFFSVEPPVSPAHASGGSSSALFTNAWQALTDILHREHIPFV